MLPLSIFLFYGSLLGFFGYIFGKMHFVQKKHREHIKAVLREKEEQAPLKSRQETSTSQSSAVARAEEGSTEDISPPEPREVTEIAGEELGELPSPSAELPKREETTASNSPKEVLALLRRAEAHIARQEFDEAKKNLIQILAWEAEHLDASIHLAFIYLETGEPSKAENLYRKVIEVKPRDPSILTNFSFAVLQQKDPTKLPESLEALRLAVELDPRNAERHANLGQSLYYTGDLVAATAAFEKAVRYAPRKVEYLFFLADSYLATEEPQKAKKTFEKILDISPFNEDAKGELELLRRKGV